MSLPLSQCLIFKAALGNQTAYNKLVEITKYNKYQGHFTLSPCIHNPPCIQPTENQLIDLATKLDEATKDIKPKYSKK
jgi:hypothetical protein